MFQHYSMLPNDCLNSEMAKAEKYMYKRALSELTSELPCEGHARRACLSI